MGDMAKAIVVGYGVAGIYDVYRGEVNASVITEESGPSQWLISGGEVSEGG